MNVKITLTTDYYTREPAPPFEAIRKQVVNDIKRILEQWSHIHNVQILTVEETP